MRKVITFDKNLSRDILDIFDKAVNEEGIIVEKLDPFQKVLTKEGDEVSLDEFGGLSKGSLVFIKSDIVSLIDFSKDRRKL